MPATHNSIIALDVGEVRVGVAVANLIARIPRPLVTLQRGADFMNFLHDVIEAEQPAAVVVGLPRGMQGQSTAQTEATEAFVQELKSQLQLPIYFQDETLTSVQAEQELEASGKTYQKGDVDALAATYILADFLADPQKIQQLEQAA